MIKQELLERTKNSKDKDEYDFWEDHIKYVVDNALYLAKEYGADVEIVELGALLHDIAMPSNIGPREEHHIQGAKIAEGLLTKYNYPQDKIERVKQCVLNHRGGKNMNEKIANSIKFYTLCTRLKDTIRTGPKVWNTKRERIESVAEHIYGVQMLALSIYYQFGYKLDINKIIYMLAIHELEEIEIGDLAFYETTREEKLIKGKEATNYILKDFLGKDEISALLDEYNERKTDEALFAYHCDKLECDIQMKLYDQVGCFYLNNQPNNPIINNPSVRKVLDSEKSISNAWIEFDRSKYEDDKNFIDIIEYLKENEI